jgi:Ca2+-transporting ATPase
MQMQPLHSFFYIDSKIVLENLQTNPLGLSEREVIKRQSEFGKNKFDDGEKISLFSTFFSQFLSPLIFILIFASIITIYLQELVETIVIWLAILINVVFSTYQEYKAENTIEQLKKIIKNKCLVKRNGKTLKIDAEELTVGDIVLLQYGSRVPADVRIIESNDLKTDEAILTGESLPVPKANTIVTNPLVSERTNYCFW